MEAADSTTPGPPPVNGDLGWKRLFSWLPSWKPTSEQQLVESERVVLKAEVKDEYTDSYIPVGDTSFVRTLTMPPSDATKNRTPLVMMHGFGCGLGAFSQNFDELHKEREVLALDVLGFGRSSRTPFTPEAEQAENELVDSLERWRQGVGLDKFVLLGHSFGAFLACSYAMRYPMRVKHLILVDPWGFSTRPAVQSGADRKIPAWASVVGLFLTHFNPLTALRVAGPLGPHVVPRVRPDLADKFGPHFMNYIYHCNAQNPSGETAFFYMQIPFAWARRPMLERMDQLDSSISMTFVYGTRSWMDNSTGEKVYAMRQDSFVDVHYVKGAGHHVYVERPDIFNDIVNRTCKLVDDGALRRSEGNMFHSH